MPEDAGSARVQRVRVDDATDRDARGVAACAINVVYEIR